MILNQERFVSSSKFEYFVIMGAGVKPGGLPSGAMSRRVEGALKLANISNHSMFLPTGGVGRYPPAEAEVMKTLLIERNIASDRIIVEVKSHDTLSSILNCSQIIKNRNDCKSVTVCTDRYHIPRCRWIFFLSGIPTKLGKMPSGYKANGLIKWLYYYLRELPAFILDTFVTLFKRL